MIQVVSYSRYRSINVRMYCMVGWSRMRFSSSVGLGAQTASRCVAAHAVAALNVKASGQTSAFLQLFMTFCFSNPRNWSVSTCVFITLLFPHAHRHHFFPLLIGRRVPKCSFLKVSVPF